ncbi:recombinase family protein [Gemmiger formicilis]|nr:recombinase family protein [Gemmiger formicilis]
MNSEMILTVLSAFAQAESESISQNVARGKRMGFRQGKFLFPYGQILGYRKGLDGKPEVIPEEAEVIRMIFNSYLQGASLLTIKKKLEAGGVLTARGNKSGRPRAYSGFSKMRNTVAMCCCKDLYRGCTDRRFQEKHGSVATILH